MTSPRSIGKVPTDDKIVQFMRLFRAFTACAGIGITIGMVFSILSSVVSLNVTALILALYLLPIGCIIFIVEWEKLFYQQVVTQFPFLKYTVGRALFYLFVAGQCLALGPIQGYVLGFAFLGIAVIGFIFYCIHGKFTHGDEQVNHEQLHEQDVEQPVVTPATQTYAADAFPGEQRPGDQSFSQQIGSAVGSAAVDWARENPDQARAAAGYAFEAAKDNPEMAVKVAKATM